MYLAVILGSLARLAVFLAVREGLYRELGMKAQWGDFGDPVATQGADP